MKIIAKTILFDKNGKILILRRSPTHPNYAHHLDFPGGEVEEGEALAEADKREITEETGLDVDVDSIRKVYEKQVTEEILHVVFAVQLKTEKPAVVLSWEHDGVEWLSRKELIARSVPENPCPDYVTTLEYIRSL